jgi:dihydrofolate reductase
MRCSVFLAASLDGFIARRDGSFDWLEQLARLDKYDNGYAQFMATVDTLVIGRNTYDVVRGFAAWPFAGKRCLVLTTRAAVAAHGEEFVAGGARDLAERLTRDGARHAYIDGGIVVRQFLDAGLVDDLTISIMPIILGAGIPLFVAGGVEQRLVLDEQRAWPTGVVQLRYSRAPKT